MSKDLADTDSNFQPINAPLAQSSRQITRATSSEKYPNLISDNAVILPLFSPYYGFFSRDGERIQSEETFGLLRTTCVPHRPPDSSEALLTQYPHYLTPATFSVFDRAGYRHTITSTEVVCVYGGCDTHMFGVRFAPQEKFEGQFAVGKWLLSDEAEIAEIAEYSSGVTFSFTDSVFSFVITRVQEGSDDYCAWGPAYPKMTFTLAGKNYAWEKKAKVDQFQKPFLGLRLKNGYLLTWANDYVMGGCSSLWDIIIVDNQGQVMHRDGYHQPNLEGCH